MTTVSIRQASPYRIFVLFFYLDLDRPVTFTVTFAAAWMSVYRLTSAMSIKPTLKAEPVSR